MRLWQLLEADTFLIRPADSRTEPPLPFPGFLNQPLPRMPLSAKPIPIVVFAQTPPPEHGQSKMVQLALDALRKEDALFAVHHINPRFSQTLDDIGESSVRKAFLTAKYLFAALRLRFRLHEPVFYYVPGPVKWSAVIRDWVLLGVLRRFYKDVVFHWHAIGQGEWAHGSDRLALPAPAWIDRAARRLSARILESPYASIPVSGSSRKDADAVASLHTLVVPNGLDDPIPDGDPEVHAIHCDRRKALRETQSPCFRILFLSHGTIEKGLTDAAASIARLLESTDSSWRFHVTFAGGISEPAREQFASAKQDLIARWVNRLSMEEVGYVRNEKKDQCFRNHDIFLASSRWESFGLTVVEAMAYGLEVVAAASDGVSGVLPDAHPYLVPTCDPDALSVALADCCRDLRAGANPSGNLRLRARFLDHFRIQDFSSNLIGTMRLLTDGPHIVARREPSRPPVNARAIRPLPRPAAIPSILVYLADQNPGYDRSFGISRMSQVVLEALWKRGGVEITTISSKTSQKAPSGAGNNRILPWGTRRKWIRLLTDHFHPLFHNHGPAPDLTYFPKGYLPLLHPLCRPSVVTIHDTIIQYDADHYPGWRKAWEYGYWAKMLEHTLRHADRIMTVSETSKRQIEAHMVRMEIPPKPVTVTYEPCAYEFLAQPETSEKENYVLHLSSVEPHKRTSHLIRWWREAEEAGHKLPSLHLVGSVPRETAPLLASSTTIVKRPFLEDNALQDAYRRAKALVLSSEIEGFGLPALEAYYLGTPVCFVRGTSVEEVLGIATRRGGFGLDDADSLWSALDEVLAMSAEEIRGCGLMLRETYAAGKVAERMMEVFRDVAG